MHVPLGKAGLARAVLDKNEPDLKRQQGEKVGEVHALLSFDTARKSQVMVKRETHHSIFSRPIGREWVGSQKELVWGRLGYGDVILGSAH